jgi:hypothetical protein
MYIHRSGSATRKDRRAAGVRVVALAVAIGLTIGACSSSSKGTAGATTVGGPAVTDASGATVTTVGGDTGGSGGAYDKATFCATAKQINALDTAMSDTANQASFQDNYDKRIAALKVLAANSPKDLQAKAKAAVTASDKLRKVLAKYSFDLAKTIADPDAAKALADGSVDQASSAMATLQGTVCQGA